MPAPFHAAALLAFVVFLWSGVFPYAKLFIIERTAARVRRGQDPPRGIQWLTAAGKWSFLDIWVVAITVLAVRINIVKEQTFIDFGFIHESFKLIVWTQAIALPGVYIFTTALTVSQVAGHVVTEKALDEHKKKGGGYKVAYGREWCLRLEAKRWVGR